MIEVVAIVAGSLKPRPASSRSPPAMVFSTSTGREQPLNGACAQARLAYYARPHIGVDLSFAAIRRMNWPGRFEEAS